MVVILGKTLAEARYWKSIYMAAHPELANAREVSSFQYESLEGLRVEKIFICPGQFENPYALEVLSRCQVKTGFYGDPIVLGAKL